MTITTIETIPVKPGMIVEEELDDKGEIDEVVQLFQGRRGNRYQAVVRWVELYEESDASSIEISEVVHPRSASVLEKEGFETTDDLPEHLDQLEEIDGVGSGTIESLRSRLEE